MKAAMVVVALSGWMAAAWLFISKPLPPVEGAAPSSGKGEVLPRELSGDATVDRIFRDWSADPALAGASVGFCLLDESGGILYGSPFAATALCPASALKTVTTSAALELLGPDYRFTTTLKGDGPVAGGVLEGGLLLIGDGDPTFSTADLEAMVRAAAAKGLRAVQGALVVGRGADHDGPVSEHWNWGDIGNAYGAGAYRLNLDHNRITLLFRPGAREGDKATLLNRDAATEDTRWTNDVWTGAPGSGDRVTVFSEPRGRTIRLAGTVPRGVDRFGVGAALPDPPAKIEEILRKRLKAAGIEIRGREVNRGSGVVPHTEFAEHASKPVVDILPHLHRVSDNLEAQCLFHAIGRESTTDPAWAIRRHWESRGVEFKGLRMIDGSGLARANMIRPLDLAKVNHLARRGPHGERFRESLTTYLDGKVRSKLGAMSGVKTDVGFITLADGRELTFCLMANGLEPGLNFWPLRDRLLKAVTE